MFVCLFVCLFCFVLFYFILFWFDLFCVVLFCFVCSFAYLFLYFCVIYVCLLLFFLYLYSFLKLSIFLTSSSFGKREKCEIERTIKFWRQFVSIKSATQFLFVYLCLFMFVYVCLCLCFCCFVGFLHFSIYQIKTNELICSLKRIEKSGKRSWKIITQ